MTLPSHQRPIKLEISGDGIQMSGFFVVVVFRFPGDSMAENHSLQPVLLAQQIGETEDGLSIKGCPILEGHALYLSFCLHLPQHLAQVHGRNSIGICRIGWN